MPALAASTASEICAEVLEHLLDMLQRTPVVDEPFTHCYFEQVFPEPLYRELLAGMPETDLYEVGRQKSEEGYSTRRNFALKPANIARLDSRRAAIWAGVSEALTSPQFRAALFARLSVGLSRRFSIAPEQASQLEAYPRPALYRDLEGYEIAPHPDTRSKIVTMQLYLPPDNSREFLGTCLYRRRFHSLAGLTRWQGRFERIKQFPFRCNSGYAFVVSNSPWRPKSWHGCEKTPPGCGLRDTLLNIYYDKPAA